jgi:hypothetical protein
LRDYGRALGGDARLNVDPWVSVLAITFGSFILVPPFVSWYRTFKRIQAAQELSGIADTVSVGLGFVLYLVALFFFPVELIYAQMELNRLLRHAAGP